jgi:hypothetical protein
MECPTAGPVLLMLCLWPMSHFVCRVSQLSRFLREPRRAGLKQSALSFGRAKQLTVSAAAWVPQLIVVAAKKKTGSDP